MRCTTLGDLNRVTSVSGGQMDLQGMRGLVGGYSARLLINYILIGTINDVVRRLDANKMSRARTISNRTEDLNCLNACNGFFSKAGTALNLLNAAKHNNETTNTIFKRSTLP